MNNDFDDRFTDDEIRVPDYDVSLGQSRPVQPSDGSHLNYYQRMQQNLSNDYAQQNYSDGYAQQGYNDGYAQQGYNDGYAQQGYNDGYAQQGYNDGYAQQGYNNGYTQQGYNNGYAQQGYNDGYVQPNYNNGYVQPNYNDGYAQQGYNNGYAQQGYNNGYAPYDPEVEEEYERVRSGDDYDFGFSPKKKKNNRTRINRPDPRNTRYEDDYDDRRPPKKQKVRRSHPILRLFFTLLILAAGLLAIAWFFLHLAFSRLDRVDPIADGSADTITAAAGVTPYGESGVMNILLIGQDARNGETQTRSDTMIICSLNRKTGNITLVSLMRDMYVPIAGYDSNKLNAAYAYGGMETLDATVQEDFGIDINGNAVVDFDGFLTALTSVGDIQIELTQEEADYLNVNAALGEDNDYVENVFWSLTAGVNTLTAKQALAYSRMRYVGNSDWDRTTRQKKVIQAVFSKLKHNPVKLIKTMNAAAPSVKTDMTDSALTRAIVYALLCGTDMKTALIPGEGMYYADSIDGMSVLVPDLDSCRNALLDYLYNGGNAIGIVSEQTTDNTTIPAITGADENQSDTDSEWPDLDGDGIGDVDEDHDGYPDNWGDTW